MSWVRLLLGLLSGLALQGKKGQPPSFSEKPFPVQKMHERIRSFGFESKRLGRKVGLLAAEGSSGWKESRCSLLEVEVEVCHKLADCILAEHKVTGVDSSGAAA